MITLKQRIFVGNLERASPSTVRRKCAYHFSKLQMMIVSLTGDNIATQLVE